MRIPLRPLVLACAALGGCAAQAQDDALGACLTLSFAPLDWNVPSCTALLEGSSDLDAETRGAVLAARAEAYDFARTYHSDHDVDDAELLAAALADLDRAAALDPAHNGRRGDILLQLGRFEEAADSYTDALAANGAARSSLLSARANARAAAGDMMAALADISAAIDAADAAPDVSRLTMLRAEMHEEAGDPAAALADYQAVLAHNPNHPGARAGVARLATASD